MWLLILLIFYVCFLTLVFFDKKLCINQGNIQHGREDLCVERKSLYLFLCFLFFCFFSTLRYPKLGTDTYAYLIMFNEIANINLNWDFSLTDEFGYTLINKIISSIIFNYQFFLFIISSFILYSFLRFIYKYSANVWFSLLLFVFAGYLDTCMSLIRFCIALSIILYSYKYVQERKLFKFIVLIFIASLFHISSWVALIIYFIYNIGSIFIGRKLFYLYLLSVLFVYYIANQFLSFLFGNIELYNYYQNDDVFGVQDSAKLAPTLELIINLCLIVYSRNILKSHESSKNELFYFNLLLFSTYFLSLSTIFTPIGRIAKYFSVALILLLPNITMFIKNKKKRSIMIILILICFAIKYIVISFLRPEWTAVYPYRFFFN